MSAIPISDGRLPPSSPEFSDGATTPSELPLVNHSPPLLPPQPLRDPLVTRGRAQSAATSRTVPSRGQTPNGQPRPKHSFEGPERKHSISYGHHRQTSIVHGFPHSRTPSHTSNGPLSPQIILSNGVNELGIHGPAPTNAAGLRKSPSASTLGGYNSASSGSLQAENPATAALRRPERMHSGRVKRDHEHHRSQSRQHGQPDLTTVGEYALHHLLTNFIKEADERIDRCMTESSEATINIETVCGPEADLAFDQLIKSLGHIGRDTPKSLIDSVMIWRRGKGEVTAQLYNELQRARAGAATPHSMPVANSGTFRRFDTSQSSVNGSSASLSTNADNVKITQIENSIRLGERRSAISVYILCRALMEIIRQCRPGTLPDDTADRLEDVIWVQVRNTDADSLQHNMVRQAQWNMFGQLLGIMSGLRFEKIVDRYLGDLAAAHKKLNVKGHAEKDLERKTSLLVENMRWLRVQISPEESWDRSCNYLQKLATQFANVHGREIKHAYCQLFEDLLLPIASRATTQLNVVKWNKVLETLRPKLTQLLVKPRHWPQAYPLFAVVMCTSQSDMFAQHWLPMALQLQPKLKDRASRSHALKALCRLVWRYLYRTNEPVVANSKKIEEIVKMIFQTGRRSILSTEPSIADPLIQLIRIIGFKCQELCFRTIIFPLMNAELFLTGRDLKIEALEPERMVIAIRAFLAIMSDLEKGEQPVFPRTFECDALMDPYSRSPHSHRRSVSQSSVVFSGKAERLSTPVMTIGFGEATKESYVKFCKILGEITIICDNAFGGQAVLDERIAQTTPKTPMADAFATFGRRDDYYAPNDARQSFYDLLHVAVQALPRCLSSHIPFNSLINLLCTGTAHVQSHIATSSAQSLKSIARQSHAQQVTIGFARFIFNFDDRYATVADGGLLGAQHIESTLRLYVELLEIWIEDLQKHTLRTPSQPRDEDLSEPKTVPSDLNRSRVFAHVDEIESHGLFFLSSPSRHVRSFAIRVLRLVNKFDSALGQPSTRIISILEGSSQQVIDVNDEKLSTAERSRLQKGLRKSNLNSTLVELCSSDISHDSTLWVKVFPNLIRLSQQICPQAVLLTREIVCGRLLHSHRSIGQLADPSFDPPYMPRFNGRHAFTSSEVTIEQWKLHLIFACTTLTNAGSGTPASSQSSQHSRKASKASSVGQDKITSASELFAKVVPFLSATNERVRVAAAVGLGTINSNLYRTLLEALQPLVTNCNDDAKIRLATHHRSVSSPRRNRKSDHLRTEITHLYRLTSHCLRDPDLRNDEWVLHNLVSFTKDLRIFLNDEDVQNQWDYQKLRTHFCGLNENLFDCISRTKDPGRWMPFQSRKAAFSMMEDWCGYSPNQAQIVQKEDHMKRSVLEQTHHLSHRGGVTAGMEIERKELRTAALSAMAALCAGPISISKEGQTTLQFDMRRMLLWVDTIFVDTPSDKTHTTGRRALKNLITHNPEHTFLLARSIEMCYLAKSQKALSSYFEVVTQVLTENVDDATPFWKVLCAALYTLGNEKSDIRLKSARLLRTLEERLQKSSKLQDLDISVSDKTTAVYKLAQFQISQRLSRVHGAMAFHVFSEFSIYFKELMPDHQRNMVTAMLPWLQTIELQVDQSGVVTANSYMLLVNLFEITVRSSTALHNEIQALWQALASGPHAGNVQLVLDFIIAVCLDRREQNFVDYAKQVVVFLSGTPAGAKVVDFLLMQLNPKAMVNEKTDPPPIPQDLSGLPYVADLAQVLPIGNKQSGLSLGQLCLMLLVDLVVSPIKLPNAQIPILLQTIITQWDHYMTLVQEQSREMLVHLIHELVISKMGPGSTEADKSSIEELIETIRRHDPKVTWSYEESQSGSSSGSGTGVPESMAFVINEVLKVFSLAYPGNEAIAMRNSWAKTTFDWATSCPVRHVACRSFQIFRCITLRLDQQMLADMLARLSNTIADDENDYLTFSQEILITLRNVIAIMQVDEMIDFPQLFWITAACLDTIYEKEFQESLTMLEELLDKLDMSDPAVIKLFKGCMPSNWDGAFEGLQPLVYKGLRSSICIDRSLAILDRMIRLPSSELVGNDNRLLFALLANLPAFLHYYDDDSNGATCMQYAETLAHVAETQGMHDLVHALTSFVHHRYRNEDEFLSATVSAIRLAFFPALEFDSLVFLIGLLNNQLSWIKTKTMKILCVIIPDVDMRKPEFASQGPDLISPVLRLLQTSYCQQALEVLDNVMSMTGTPLDNKHIRMSMAGSHSSRATRKEYDSTKSLYGIPEESGWSVPMPAIHSARTRHNVQAVVRTCANIGTSGLEKGGTPIVDLADDQHYNGYFPEQGSGYLPEQSNEHFSEQYNGTTRSINGRGDGSMGELVMKLDSLDDFFDDQDQVMPPGREILPLYSTGLHDDRESLYDKQTLPILHKSLNRNASVTSFHTGFADRGYREPMSMTPMAFAPNHFGPTTNRPGLHSRSITSPAASIKRPPGKPPNDLLSGDEGGDEPEPFSDGDLSLSRTQTSDDSFGFDETVRNPIGLRAGFRQGMRRLTGGVAERREASETLRNMAFGSQKSPRVPKVPAAYLQDFQSSDS